MLIHHSGKEDDRGPRGSSALNGAIDSSFVVHRDKESGSATISADLQRDGDASFIAGFRLVPIVLAKDRDGDEIVSMAVEPTEAARLTPARPRLSDNARVALDVLADLIARQGEVIPPADNIPPGTVAVTWSAWRSALDQRSPDETADAKRKRMSRAATTLIAKGCIAMSGGFVWLCGTGARP
ncbi:MAG: hypothetical protein FJX57_02585 [Alphaproteobacteria bacterium]|nr:hypothetical protein [Alphaproteobacteria bacterium]